MFLCPVKQQANRLLTMVKKQSNEEHVKQEELRSTRSLFESSQERIVGPLSALDYPIKSSSQRSGGSLFLRFENFTVWSLVNRPSEDGILTTSSSSQSAVKSKAAEHAI